MVQSDLGLAVGEVKGLVAGDFNGDGRVDLALVGQSDETGDAEVEVLLGDGDGTFRAAPQVDLGNLSFDFPVYGTSALVVGDFGGDGRADLAVAGTDSSTGENEVEVLSNNSDGTFDVSALVNLGTLSPSFLETGNFTGDGRADLAVAGTDTLTGDDEVEVLSYNSDGTFHTAPPVDVGHIGVDAVVVGDFTGDGRTDIAVAWPLEVLEGLPPFDYEVEVLLGNGDGTFQAAAPIDLGTLIELYSLVTGDFTDDGHSDLAVAGLVFNRRERGCGAVIQQRRHVPCHAAGCSGESHPVFARIGRFHRRRPQRSGLRRRSGLLRRVCWRF